MFTHDSSFRPPCSDYERRLIIENKNIDFLFEFEGKHRREEDQFRIGWFSLVNFLRVTF